MSNSLSVSLSPMELLPTCPTLICHHVRPLWDNTIWQIMHTQFCEHDHLCRLISYSRSPLPEYQYGNVAGPKTWFDPKAIKGSILQEYKAFHYGIPFSFIRIMYTATVWFVIPHKKRQKVTEKVMSRSANLT